MDHVVCGLQLRHYCYPKAFLSEGELTDFGDGLRDIIPEKLSELNRRADELEKERTDRLKKLKNYKTDSFTRWFIAYFIELDFSEYQIVQRWLRYWLKLLQTLNETKSSVLVEFEKKGVTEEDIARAKEFPLEQLYVGQLRKTGNRLQGLCPFHEEKTPSFVIYEDQNRFHCFGCGANGDSVDFIQKRENCGMVEAVKRLL